MIKSKIDIVEDHQVIRENVKTYIEFHDDLEVNIVSGSIESYILELKKDPNNKANALLLDVGLPGKSGIEGIPEILAIHPDLDIIMLTTYEEEEVILRAICSGACSYISKKASLEEIVKALRIVIGGGSYMSPSIAREIVKHLMGGRVSKATILSVRQKEILELLVDGKSYSKIAEELFISIETVRSHVKKLYKVLQVNNKSEAISMYLKGHIK